MLKYIIYGGIEVRVITGKVKGHRLKSPKGLNTRPTSDRVKESIFNIIGRISEDSSVLDLFSGSGNIGIEFLSRGAKECYFIDQDTDSIKAIKENLNSTRLTSQAYVYKNDVIDAISLLGRKGIKFNYIFMDPPYEKNLVLATLEKIQESELLSNTCLVVIEHESKSVLPDNFHRFIKCDYRKYGSTSVTFYKFEEV